MVVADGDKATTPARTLSECRRARIHLCNGCSPFEICLLDVVAVNTLGSADRFLEKYFSTFRHDSSFRSGVRGPISWYLFTASKCGKRPVPSRGIPSETQLQVAETSHDVNKTSPQSAAQHWARRDAPAGGHYQSEPMKPPIPPATAPRPAPRAVPTSARWSRWRPPTAAPVKATEAVPAATPAALLPVAAVTSSSTHAPTDGFNGPASLRRLDRPRHATPRRSAASARSPIFSLSSTNCSTCLPHRPTSHPSRTGKKQSPGSLALRGQEHLRRHPK